MLNRRSLIALAVIAPLPAQAFRQMPLGHADAAALHAACGARTALYADGADTPGKCVVCGCTLHIPADQQLLPQRR